MIDVSDPIAPHIQILDLDTGNFIDNVKWINEETGEYEQFVLDSKGYPIINKEDAVETMILKGNIQVVYLGTDD